VRERPEDEPDARNCPICGKPWGKLIMGGCDIGFCFECYNNASGKKADARIRQLEQERDEAAEIIRQAKSLMSELYNWIEWWPNGPETWDATEAAIDAFLAKHPQPAKEQVE
jgi:hypothetical protein